MESTLRDELAELESTLSSLETNLDIVRRSNEEVSSIRTRESEIKEARGKISKSMKEFASELEKTEDNLDKVNDEFATAERQLQLLQEQQIALDNDIKDSDESETLETGKIKLATYERMKLAQEKVELARIIDATAQDEESGANSRSLSDADTKLIELKAAMNTIQSEKNITEAEYLSVAEKCSDFRQKVTDLKVSMSAEISSIQQFCENQKAAVRAEKETLNSLTKQFEDEKLRLYEEMKSSASKELKEKQFQVIMLKQAKEIIEYAEAEEKMILSTENEVNPYKDGNDTEEENNDSHSINRSFTAESEPSQTPGENSLSG